MIAAAALVATVWIVGAYARSTRTGNPRPFALANAVGCLPILLAAAVAGAWATMPITAAFGAIGAWGYFRA